MKTPVRSSKKSPSKVASQSIAVPGAPFPKLAIAGMPYKAAEGQAMFEEVASDTPSVREGTKKKKW
jgi:hypothetical protein